MGGKGAAQSEGNGIEITWLLSDCGLDCVMRIDEIKVIDAVCLKVHIV